MDTATEPAAASHALSRQDYAVTVQFDLEEGAFPEFYRLVSENARESVSTERGCVRFDVLTPSDAAGSRIFLYEIYEDRAAFDLHLASKHFKRFDESTQALVRRKVVREFAVAQNAKASS